MELFPVKTKINHVYTFEEPLYNKLYVPMCLKTCAHVLSMWALPPEVMNKAKKAFFLLVHIVTWNRALKKDSSLKPSQWLVRENLSEAVPLHWSRALLAGMVWTFTDFSIWTFLLSPLIESILFIWLCFLSHLWEEVFIEPQKIQKWTSITDDKVFCFSSTELLQTVHWK